MNPSSSHLQGKRAAAVVSEVAEFLKDYFKISHQLFFHSGATEGNNTIIKAHKGHFFYSPFDHPSVRELAHHFGDNAHQIEVNRNGEFDFDWLVAKIKELDDAPVLVNYTAVNSETGVCWDLDDAVKLKRACGCLVHVDASQLVGKVDVWNQLPEEIDAYTFSGHKFGALKGVGFSFYHRDFPLLPLIEGGGQQKEMRSGTLNVAGIYSIKLALEEITASDSVARDFFEHELITLLGDRGEVLCCDAKKRSNNTIYFVLFDVKSETLLAAFDLAGIDLSSGSACSAGISEKNAILNHIYSDASRVMAPIRISFSPHFSLSFANKVFKRAKKILMPFLEA